MLPCETHGCAYQKTLQGDRHSVCTRKFTLDEVRPILLQMTLLPPHVIKWFLFPYNFNPTWGPDMCKGFSTHKDFNKTRTISAEEELLGIFGNRM